jgi:HPt (histidine-containing phosphotransfer) domain-containing protein
VQPPKRTASGLDIEASLERLNGDIVLLKELASIFLTECPRLLSEIRQAIALRNSRALAYAAHSLKGAVASLKAPDVAESARRLEAMGEKGDLSCAEETYVELVEKLDRLIASIQQLLQQDG